jgi:phospholipid/cholesterol/gamma-HCH transport system substrate-binding protein
MSKRVIVNLAFFVFVFLVMLTWAAQNIVSIRAIDQPYEIKGDFVAASGVMPNAEVAYLGVHYGRVTKVELEPGQVMITMDIDKGKHIPKHSLARIFRKSAIGEPYIDFQPPKDFDFEHASPADYINKGDVVPMDETRNPLEFSELLRSMGALLSHIDPNKAGTLVHELAVAVDGRGDSLRTLTKSLDTLATTFAAKTDVLDRLATNNTKLTHVFADHATDLGTSITNLKLLADSLKNANGNTAVLLDQGSQLMGQVADLVSAEKSNLDCTLHDLGDLIDATSTPARLDGLTTMLDVGPQAFGQVFGSRDVQDDGVWVRVNLMASPGAPPAKYDPPHELPTVPAIPACASTVGAISHGPDFVPADVLAQSSSSAQGRSLPATGGAAMAGVAAMLLVAGFTFRWVSRAARG